MKAGAASTELSASPVVQERGTPTLPLVTPSQPPFPPADTTDQRFAMVNGTVGTGASPAAATAGIPEVVSVQPASTAVTRRVPDTSSPVSVETSAARLETPAVEGPAVGLAARASRGPKAPLVTVPDGPGLPTGRGEDRTTITGLEAVATSGPRA